MSGQERIVFKSLAQSHVRYTWYRHGYDSPVADYRGHNSRLGDNCGWYDTHGDGECQHSPEYAVAIDGATDYFASLLSHLANATPNDRHDMLDAIAYDWPNMEHRDRKSFVFAIGLKYKEGGKTQYFNMEDLKTSTSHNKQYDKRWNVVAQYHDGSPESAFRLLSNYGCLLHRYAVMRRLAEVWREEMEQTIAYLDCGTIAGMFPATDDCDERAKYRRNANNLANAFDGIDMFVKSWRYSEYAIRHESCQQTNYVSRMAEEMEVA